MEEAARFRGFHSRVGRQKSDGVFKITWGPNISKGRLEIAALNPRAMGWPRM